MFRRRFFIVEERASDDVSVFKSNHVVVISLVVAKDARVLPLLRSEFP